MYQAKCEVISTISLCTWGCFYLSYPMWFIFILCSWFSSSPNSLSDNISVALPTSLPGNWQKSNHISILIVEDVSLPAGPSWWFLAMFFILCMLHLRSGVTCVHLSAPVFTPSPLWPLDFTTDPSFTMATRPDTKMTSPLASSMRLIGILISVIGPLVSWGDFCQVVPHIMWGDLPLVPSEFTPVNVNCAF